MDQREANEALTRADSLGQQMRHRARWMAGSITAMGLLTIGMVLLIGLYGDNTTLRNLAYLTVLAALIGMNWYAHSRPVLLRRHLAVHYALTGVGVALFTCTVTVGLTVFPESLLWWIGGALLSGLPFFLSLSLNLVSSRQA